MTERLEEIFDPPPDDPQIEIGTAGWDTHEEHFDKGEVDDDGHDLVRVTLYRGRDASRRPQRGVASGYRILCMLADHCGLPKKGARVYVALPPGYGQVPGAAVIIAVVEPGLGRFDNVTDNARTLAAPSGAARVTVKDDGSIVFFTTADNTKDGQSICLRITTDTLRFEAPWGRLVFDATGFHTTHSSGAAIDLGAIQLPAPFDTPPLNALASYIRLTAATIAMPAANVSHGDGTPDQLAKASPIIAVLEAIAAALATGNSGGPIVLPPPIVALFTGSPAPIEAAIASTTSST